MKRTVRIHKIHWGGRFNSFGKDLDFTIIDTDCFVEKVGHPCMKWAVGEAWYRVCAWLQKKNATITLGEPVEVEDKKC